jgi:hypothetical protein
MTNYDFDEIALTKTIDFTAFLKMNCIRIPPSALREECGNRSIYAVPVFCFAQMFPENFMTNYDKLQRMLIYWAFRAFSPLYAEKLMMLSDNFSRASTLTERELIS